MQALFKLAVFMVLNLFMTIVYAFVPDTEFSGLNRLQQAIEQELFERQAERTIATDQPRPASEVLESKPLKVAGSKRLLERLFHRFYFCIVTSTTLGFGDIYPNTVRTKALVILHLGLVFLLIAQ